MYGIVLQCGGPTAVMNASLAGVIGAVREAPSIAGLWGARQGWHGLATGAWVELAREQDPRLEARPGAALGSGRTPLADAQLPELLARLEKREVGIVWVIGGNGAMDAAARLSRAGGGALRVIGIPKTVDNDLPVTDFSPGYGSAARFVAQAVHDAGLDLRSMRGFDEVAVFEVMGRHAGWLAAAAALARVQRADPPHLILVPEVPVDEDNFVEAVKAVRSQEGVCLVVAAEGIRDPEGRLLAEKAGTVERDASGQALLGLGPGVAGALARVVKDRLGYRCRQIRPDTILRSASAHVSQVDREQARLAGIQAVRAAVGNFGGVMIALERVAAGADTSQWASPQALAGAGWRTVPVSLDQVAGKIRALPPEFLAPSGFDVTPAFLDWARPLIDGWRP